MKPSANTSSSPPTQIGKTQTTHTANFTSEVLEVDLAQYKAENAELKRKLKASEGRAAKATSECQAALEQLQQAKEAYESARQRLWDGPLVVSELT